MARETLTKIFTPFFTTEEQGKGTGLGLYTVYSIVKEHHGTIEVESHPGAGTRFLICFPRIEAPAREPLAFTELQPSKGRETGLLVEDEEAIRTMLSQSLRNLGYTILEASDGVSALQVFADYGKAVHLLVSDVVMPRMSGTDLYDRLRAQKPELKALFMSGYPREVISARVVRDEEMELLAKPFTVQTLVSRIREILDR